MNVIFNGQLMRIIWALCIVQYFDFCWHSNTGEGSYGKVYKGLDKKTGELVAVKMVPNEEESALEKEIRMLKDCNSEYVVKYLASYFKDQMLWLIME